MLSIITSGHAVPSSRSISTVLERAMEQPTKRANRSPDADQDHPTHPQLPPRNPDLRGGPPVQGSQLRVGQPVDDVLAMGEGTMWSESPCHQRAGNATSANRKALQQPRGRCQGFVTSRQHVGTTAGETDLVEGVQTERVGEHLQVTCPVEDLAAEMGGR